MGQKQSIVEETLRDIKHLDTILEDNVKGILASTMKQEISELVKESLNEAEDEEEEVSDMLDQEDDVVDDEALDAEASVDDMDFIDAGDDEEADFDDEMVDLTGATDEDVIKVFKSMKDDDSVVVKKEGGKLHLTDNEEGREYLIDINEDESNEFFWNLDNEDEPEESEEDDEFFDEDDEGDDFYMRKRTRNKEPKIKRMPKMDMDEESTKEQDIDKILDDIFTKEKPNFEDDEVYEVEMDDATLDEAIKGAAEKNTAMKPKMGSIKKADAKQKAVVKEPKEEEELDVEYDETMEASRTLSNGKRFGRRGLNKPKSAPRHIALENKITRLESKLAALMEVNDEYRKTCNLLRGKLNETVVFNTNLAYVSKLFTENSTTKAEKLSILERFDGVTNRKDSKSLYKVIKGELSSKEGGVMTENITEKMERSPKTGSATHLIESKMYENPEFLRIKDLMGKIK